MSNSPYHLARCGFRFIAFSLAVTSICSATLSRTASAQDSASNVVAQSTANETSNADAWKSLYSAAKILPPSTIAVAHFRDPSVLVDSLLSHPLRPAIEALPPLEAAMEGDQMRGFLGGLTLAEYRMGMKWQEVLQTVTANGTTVAFDPTNEAVIVLTKASGSEQLAGVIGEALEFVQAVSNNENQALQIDTYREMQRIKAQDAIVLQVEDWLVATNKMKAAEELVDRFLEETPGLDTNSRFITATEAAKQDFQAAIWSDVKTIREAGLAQDLFQDQAQDFGAELIVGGILRTLVKTDYALVTVNLTEEAFTIEAAAPFQASWLEGPREFYFGQAAAGKGPVAVHPNNELLSLSTYRDIAGLWLAKEDLFEERVIAELSQVDSNLSTIFSGVDFGEEVLGAAQPAIQIVATRQDFQDLSTPVPAIKLPAFALLFELREPEEVQRRFKIAFQSVIGFVNIGLGQQGQPQLEISTEQVNGTRVTSATYMADPDDEGRINYNFSPSLAFVDDRMILSSTQALAAEITQLMNSPTSSDTSAAHTTIDLDGNVLSDVLRDNRPQLVAQNMLEEGNAKAEAEAAIDTLLEAAELFKSLDAKLRAAEDVLRFNIDIQWALPATSDQ